LRARKPEARRRMHIAGKRSRRRLADVAERFMDGIPRRKDITAFEL
jgi:hypothetical protein